MAGDWIKLRLDLRTDPAVFKLASITKLDRFAVVGRLAEFWGWADKHAVDGVVDGASSTVVDDVVSFDGFAAALVAVDWLKLHDDSIEIPKHERHNSESAKERGLKNARQARWRANKDATPPTHVDDQPSTDASTREEKRREDIKEAKASSRATKKCPPSFEVSDDMLAWASSECPDVSINTETAKLRDHTFKTARSDWPGTWRNWMRKANEDAASKPAARNAPESFKQSDDKVGRARWEEMTGRTHPDNLTQPKPAHGGMVVDITPKTLEISQ